MRECECSRRLLADSEKYSGENHRRNTVFAICENIETTGNSDRLIFPLQIGQLIVGQVVERITATELFLVLGYSRQQGV